MDLDQQNAIHQNLNRARVLSGPEREGLLDRDIGCLAYMMHEQITDTLEIMKEARAEKEAQAESEGGEP